MNEEWEQKIFDATFDSVLKDMRTKVEADPQEARLEANRIIDQELLTQDQDWTGRGQVAQLKSDATIAACYKALKEITV